MRLQTKLGFSVPTAILASETLKTVALQDFEGLVWKRPYHTPRVRRLGSGASIQNAEARRAKLCYCFIIDFIIDQYSRYVMVAETRTLTAQVPVELAEEVDALSEQIERPRQWIIKKALVQYLAREAEKRRLIQEGLDDVTGGRLVPMEQARAWANSLGTDNELPVPKA